MADAPTADPFAPPAVSRTVRCRKCGRCYPSARIEWRTLPPGWPIDGAWCCPTPDCIAVGFGFDIQPADGATDGARGGPPR